MKISVKKEKAIVFVSGLMALATGYIASFNPVVAGVIGSATALTMAFWSEGINTGEAN